MSKKFRLLMVLVLVIGLFGGLLTASTVSADPLPGLVVEIPRIDLGDVFGTTIADWQTRIQVQNVGSGPTGVVAIFWPGFDGTCPSSDPGPMGHACMWLPYNGVWTLRSQIPAGAKSAIIYSVDPDDFNDACTKPGSTTAWRDWVDDYANTGQPLAVTVDRWGTDSYGEFDLSSSYTGVADPDMVDPRLWGPPYEYFAPYVMHGYNNLDTTITIQNSGDICASIWIYYKGQGNCEFMKAQHIEAIAPGQAIRIGPGADKNMAYPSPELDAPWLGAAYVTSNVPLGIIVDQLSHAPSANRAVLSTMRGMPFWYDWNRTWYADLLYREISGWTSSIQVQNLTKDSMPTFVTVEFFDQSGDSILFVGDWVCRNGSNTFYLPAIIDLGVNFPFGYVGAAEIQSHWQVDYPGGEHEGEPIFAVVDLKKTKVYDDSTGFWRHTVAGETQAGAYNAHPETQKENAWGWAMPHIAKEQDGVTSRIAIRNNANCNKISGTIYIKDETGTIVAYIPVPWLHPKHMKIFDLAYIGAVARGFVGAAEFFVEGVEQLCDVNADGITDQLPVMPSVVVLNYGFAKELPIGSGAGPLTDLGDLTRVYEGIPFGDGGLTCTGSLFGTATVRQANHGLVFPYLQNVAVEVDDGSSGVTDSTGGYQIKGVEEGDREVTFSKSGFFDLPLEAEVECGKETKLDPELICTNTLLATVEDTAFNRIPGATVTAKATFKTNGLDETYTTSDTTDNAGVAEFDVAGGYKLEVTASADGHDDAVCTTVTGVDAVDVCLNEPVAGCELCKWATAVGTIEINDEPAAGYTVKALNMTTLDWADTDVTTAAGVFSVENLSIAASKTLGYRLYLYNTSDTLISTTGSFVLDADDCGATGVFTYTDGAWDSPWLP